MSADHLASFTESMPISRVVQELRSRGLNMVAPDQELRGELARAIFAENGVYVAPESSSGQREESSPMDTVRNVEHQPTPVRGSLPGQPPAESTRLNGDFRSAGAIPRQTAHQSLMEPGVVVSGRVRHRGSSIPATISRACPGNLEPNYRAGGVRPLKSKDSYQ